MHVTSGLVQPVLPVAQRTYLAIVLLQLVKLVLLPHATSSLYRKQQS